MTYVSTQSISTVLRQSLLKMQQDMSDASTESTTGHYADTGLTLGGRSAESLSLQMQASQLQTITTTNGTVATRLSATQTTLSSLQSSAQDMLNSLIAADGTGSTGAVVQQSATNDLKTLISGLNSALGGEYIFGGTNSGAPPITDYFAAGAANKSAVDTAFQSAFGMSPTDSNVGSISGTAMSNFLDTQLDPMFSGSGATWTPNWSQASDQAQTTSISTSETADTSVSANQTAFKQLAEAYTMLGQLGTANLSSDAYQAISTRAATLLKNGISGLVDLQASVGVTQSQVTSSTANMSLQMDILSTQVSNLQSVDPYTAVTRVQNLQTQIETAYSLTSQIHNLSLVKYL